MIPQGGTLGKSISEVEMKALKNKETKELLSFTFSSTAKKA